MTTPNRLALCAVLALSMALDALHAGPMERFGPFDITGTVASVRWVPFQRLKGEAGVSGPRGFDRVIQSHFMVLVKPFSGVDPGLVFMLNIHAIRTTPGAEPTALERSAEKDHLLLRIEHEDKAYLKPGMRIRVEGYVAAGDEGGCWTSFNALKIVPVASPPAPSPSAR